MALFYRRTLRNAVLSVLTDVSTGFNARLAGLASAYGITAFSIDFTGAQKNFAIGHVDPHAIETSPLLNFPAACLYTTDAVDNSDAKQFSFSGQVMINLDFYVRDRQGVEDFNTEDMADAIEDAAVSAINNRANQWPGGFIFSRNTKLEREYLIPLGDGFATRIPIATLFEVYIP